MLVPSGTGGTGASIAEKMRITNAGNVGIGTTSPSLSGGSRTALTLNDASLSIYELAVGGTLSGYLYSSSSQVTLNSQSTRVMTFETNGAERVRIDSSGNVGVNQTSPTCSLDVSGCIRSTSGSAATPTSGTGVEMYYDTTNDEGKIRTYNESATSSPYYKPLLIDGSSIALNDISDGQVGVCCSPSYTLDVNGTVHYVTLTASSDERFKKKIEPVQNVLPDLMKLEPVKFEWNETINNIRSGYKTDEPTYGFIAQKVKDIFPELVSQWKASDEIPDAHSLSYERMIPLLVAAIQELYRLVSAG